MDYTRIIQELRAATLFDLYRMRVAIEQQLDSPERIEQVRSRLKPGMRITYFEETANRLVEATVLELNRTRLLVENHEDGKHWLIRFCTVNIDEVATDLRPGASQKTLDRSLLHVGDPIGFRDRQNREKYGRIIALNQKSATIMTNNQERWRVAYAYLFPVIDTDSI